MKIRELTKIIMKSTSWPNLYVISVFYPAKHTDAGLKTAYKSFRILKLINHGQVGQKNN